MALSRWWAAVLPARGGEDGGAPLPERAWRASVVGMHLFFAVVLALVAVAGALSGPASSRPVVFGALAALAMAYVLWGAPAIADEHPARAVGYLCVLVAVVGVLSWQNPNLLFVLFAGYTQVWFLVESTRPGVLWTVALTASTAIAPLAAVLRGEASATALLSTAVGMIFSLALGFWVSRVMEQSRQRATLIDQLQHTRAELAAAHHEQGVLAERERLAREVHDTLAQGYTSIVVLAQTAAAQLPEGADAARERLAVIEEVARDNLQEARAVVAAFAPVALEGSSLVEALDRLAERFGRETGLAVRVDTAALDGGVALRRDEEVVLLRGAQEALTNVRRHADATSVAVRICAVGEGDARHVSVHVEDDGVGFDPSQAEGTGLGGLRDRVASVGGEVDVASAPGAGTRVTVRVPGS